MKGQGKETLPATSEGQKTIWRGAAWNLGVTLVLWAYFTLGFVLFFSPFYFWVYLTQPAPHAAFQRLNHRFFRSFFRLLKWLVPGQKWRISTEVSEIRSAVIISNHLSYLDPLLFISLYPRQATIAKSRLFTIPFFGRVVRLSGYLPSKGEGDYADLMVAGMERLQGLLASGGNFFVFPEGTRRGTGRLGRLNMGAFKIARMLKAPIAVVLIRNTDRLFTPGRFLFNTREDNTIVVDFVDMIHPDYEDPDFSTRLLMDQAAQLLSGAVSADGLRA